MKRKRIFAFVALSILLCSFFTSYGVSNNLNIGLINIKESNHLYVGNYLYVGGTGPNNYTSIQDAIDNASHRDIVYVFNDSSPYYESLFINKIISIYGEERDSTVISGNGSDYVIEVIDGSLSLLDISIKNGGQTGIYIHSSDDNHNDFLTINNCIVSDTGLGMNIRMTRRITIRNSIIENNPKGGCSISENSKYVTIFNCLFNNNWNAGGIYYNSFNEGWIEVYNCEMYNNKIGVNIDTNNANVYKNIIRNNVLGILIFGKYGNIFYPINNINIQKNYIENNGNGSIDSGGIYIHDTGRVVQITNNNIINNNGTGIFVLRSVFNKIEQNNFINNSDNAFHLGCLFRNKWDYNYWDDSQVSPYIIDGRIGFIFSFIPWRDYDYNPAQEPYDIGV